MSTDSLKNKQETPTVDSPNEEKSRNKSKDSFDFTKFKDAKYAKGEKPGNKMKRNSEVLK